MRRDGFLRASKARQAKARLHDRPNVLRFRAAVSVNGLAELEEHDRHMGFQKELRGYNFRPWLTVAGVSVLVLSAAGIVQAAMLTNSGTAILVAGSGSAVVSGNQVTSGCINWYNGGTPPSCPSASTGLLTVEAGSTSPFTVGASGSIQNLDFNTVFPVVDFMTIGGLDFDLLDLRFNTGAAIGDCTSPGDTDPGVSCTPSDSPFTLTNGLTDPATGMVDTVTLSFVVDAEGYTGSSGTNYNQANAYIGIFSAETIQGQNIQTVLTTLAGGGSINFSWGATFTPVAAQVPEPASFVLLGAALTAIGLLKRNFARPF
jgi:hypothetical protein